MKLPVVPSKKDPWYADGLQFTCTQCGHCCTGGPGFVWMSRDEIIKLAAFLKLSPEETVEQYCRKVDGKWSLNEVRDVNGSYDCVFLKEVPLSPSQLKRVASDPANEEGKSESDPEVVYRKKGCSIYPVRPLQCRTWPFWPELLSSKKNWDHAARKCHGMNIGRSFSLTQITTIRDAREWPDSPPTSATKKS